MLKLKLRAAISKARWRHHARSYVRSHAACMRACVRHRRRAQRMRSAAVTIRQQFCSKARGSVEIAEWGAPSKRYQVSVQSIPCQAAPQGDDQTYPGMLGTHRGQRYQHQDAQASRVSASGHTGVIASALSQTWQVVSSDHSSSVRWSAVTTAVQLAEITTIPPT